MQQRPFLQADIQRTLLGNTNFVYLFKNAYN